MSPIKLDAQIQQELRVRLASYLDSGILKQISSNIQFRINSKLFDNNMLYFIQFYQIEKCIFDRIIYDKSRRASLSEI